MSSGAAAALYILERDRERYLKRLYNTQRIVFDTYYQYRKLLEKKQEQTEFEKQAAKQLKEWLKQQGVIVV